MDFERGNDIKETIGIGRKANAIKVVGYYLLGKVEFDDGWVSANMGFTTTDKLGTEIILAQVCSGLHPRQKTLKELFYDYLKRRARGKGFDHPLTLDDSFRRQSRIIIIDWNIQIRVEYNPFSGNVSGRKPYELKGEDLVHEGILYTIPK